MEIGPGRGAITRLLAEKGCRVVALEVDRDLCRTLSEEFGACENVRVIETDALEFDFNSLLDDNVEDDIEDDVERMW